MLKRLWIYVREMFPPVVNIPFTVLMFFGIFCFTHIFVQENSISWRWEILSGYVTLLLISLMMRIADEFKDEETDRNLFPERPYPRGAVKRSDLKALFYGSLAVVILCNVWNYMLLVSISVVLLYGFLTFKWFFIEDKMRNSLTLALVSHQPLALLLNLYLVVFATVYLGSSFSFSLGQIMQLLLLALFFWMPILAWETSRKVRGEGKETDYVTYSKLFGPRKAAAVPLCFLLLASGINIYFHLSFSFGWTNLAVILLATLFIAIVYSRFILKPTRERNLVKMAAEVFSSILILNLVVHSVIKIYYP